MDKDKFLEVYRKRSYLHFDVPFSSEDEAWDYVSGFSSGTPHGFLPFLGYSKNILRITRDKDPTLPRKQRKISQKIKKRAIKIASHKDTAIYAYYGRLLEDRYEGLLRDYGIGECVTAFRESSQGRCNIHHAKEVFDFISDHRPSVALAFDVKQFFDTLSHRHLLQMWQKLLKVNRLPADHYKVYKSLTRFSWVSRKQVFQLFGISEHNPKLRPPNKPRLRICSPYEFRKEIRERGLLQGNPYKDRGIPQGSPMSAVLSNIYMLDFDRCMHDYVRSINGLYRRYCDDIMLVVPPEHEREARLRVYCKIRQLKLTCNPQKTDIVHFNDESSPNEKSIQYLGFLYNGESVFIRPSSLSRYYGKMRKNVRLAGKSYSKALEKSTEEPVRFRTRKLYLRYSHLISSQRGGKKQALRLRSNPYLKQNFISYALRASRIMGSPEIKRQIRGHWKKLNQSISKEKQKTVRRRKM